jgi:hypothetical protein
MFRRNSQVGCRDVSGRPNPAKFAWKFPKVVDFSLGFGLRQGI